MEGTIASVLMFAGTFAPKSWAYCQGQILSIASNTALFSIIGTMYGGDGKTTFALPDFQGRMPVGAGQGPGLPDYQVGQMGGFETVTLTQSQMPMHSHNVRAQITVSSNNPTTTDVNGSVYAPTSTNNYIGPTYKTGDLGGLSFADMPTGGNAPMTLMQPTLGMNIIICLYGVFPSRN